MMIPKSVSDLNKEHDHQRQHLFSHLITPPWQSHSKAIIMHPTFDNDFDDDDHYYHKCWDMSVLSYSPSRSDNYYYVNQCWRYTLDT